MRGYNRKPTISKKRKTENRPKSKFMGARASAFTTLVTLYSCFTCEKRE